MPALYTGISFRSRLSVLWLIVAPEGTIMKHHRWLPLSLVLVSCFPVPGGTADATGNTKALVQANNAFAFDLYGRLKASPGNLFFSPYSISTCLAMTYAGARAHTETQMARVLHFTSEAQVNAGFAALQSQLKAAEKEKGIELNIANALWAQQGHPFLPQFLNIARQEYKAQLQQTDFRQNGQAAARDINQWVAEITKNRIQQIVSPDAFNASTRLVLANAIYFKGTWAVQFQPAATRPMPFHVTSTRQQETPFMSHTDSVNYTQTPIFQAIELPYAGGDLSMIILLPREIDGSSQVESALTSASFTNLVGQMRKMPVQIFLPRFKMDSGFNLNGPLVALGMSDAFSERADFSGMDGTRRLFISSVFHKAWVEVNEEGTEAAAATAAVMSASAVHKEPAPPPVFRADHPFVFLIREARSGSVLFMGRLAEPGR